MTPAPQRASLPLIGGLLACAACCTLPFLVPVLLGVGVGSGLLTWLATRSELLGLTVLALGGAVALWRWRANRRSAPAGAACRVDGGCGCAPTPSSSPR